MNNNYFGFSKLKVMARSLKICTFCPQPKVDEENRRTQLCDLFLRIVLRFHSKKTISA